MKEKTEGFDDELNFGKEQNLVEQQI